MESIIVRASREDVLHFLSITPYWSYGYSIGCGHGYSNGYGFGDICRSDFSDGIGYGFGYGYGTGSGGCPEPGHGCGFGCGAGGIEADKDECGKFLCKDIKSLNGNIVDYIDSIPTIITQVYGNFAYGYIVKKDLTVSPCFIARVGNSLVHGDTLKKAIAGARDKEIKNIPQIMNR